MTHEEKMAMRKAIYQHLNILLDKVHRMFEQGDLSVAQMSVGADMLKDMAKADSAMSKACYYDSKHDTDEYRKY